MLNAVQINNKNSTLSIFPSSNDETSKIVENYWPFLYLNFTRVLQFSSTSPRL